MARKSDKAFDSTFIPGMGAYIEARQSRYDQIMIGSRMVIRHSAELITALHNSDYGKADEIRLKLKDEAARLMKDDSGFEYNAMQAYQEYSEAMLFWGVKKKGKLPGYREIGVSIEPYLLGLMDLVGELRREVTEALNGRDVRRAESYFELIKRIYDYTRPVRVSDAILPGFRRKQDVARIQVENAGLEILNYKTFSKLDK